MSQNDQRGNLKWLLLKYVKYSKEETEPLKKNQKEPLAITVREMKPAAFNVLINRRGATKQSQGA